MSLHRKQQQTKLPLARLAGSPHIRRMIDPFGRAITYLRVSVTDRCDFRCAYCMTDTMSFLPREELLSLEELDRLVSAFVGLGVRKLRLTGGEPLVRRNLMWLVERLGRHIESGALEELTLTTNGSQLARHAATLRSAGIERINVSLDTLDPTKFAEITRGGRLSQVLGGIDAARSAGLAIKINTVVLKGVNEHEITHLVAWCGQQEFDLALIEVMPMGEVEAEMRTDQYVPLSLIRARLEADWTLRDTDYRTGGPARYVTVEETGRRLGFITPLTHNFCDACNRVRLTCTGKLFMCLGQEDAADFRPILRAHALDDRRAGMALEEAILNAIGRKPRGHDFVIDRVLKTPAIGRAMSVTGG